MTEDQFLLLLTLISVVAWTLALALLVRGHRLTATQALAALFLIAFVGLVGQLGRSLLEDGIAVVIVGISRAVFLIVPIAIVWEWLTDGGSK